MGSILKAYEKAAKSANVFGKETDKARRWFVDVVNKLPINRNRLLSDDRVKVRSNFLPGRMYAFAYDPKTKETLPYYDRFPLVILLGPSKSGDAFLGLNLHYLPPKTRAEFLSTLMDFTTDKRYDERTRFSLTYSMINRAAKFRLFRPCLKSYLPNHVVSNMVEVAAKDWLTACFLPVEHFAKENKYTVWSNSMRSFNG